MTKKQLEKERKKAQEEMMRGGLQPEREKMMAKERKKLAKRRPK